MVVLDGTPLHDGVIRFIPQAPTTGPASSAAIIDGKFETPDRLGPLTGTHRVEITFSPEETPDPDDQAAVAKYLVEQKNRKRRIEIPPRYNSRSELTAVLTENGPNELTFELKSRN